jgi:hypothetical protein
VTTIALDVLDQDAVEQIGAMMLRQVDSATLGATASRTLGETLIGITNRRPLTSSWLHRAWASAPAGNKAAIADCLINGNIPGGIDTARELARRGCPPEVEKRILSAIDSHY